MSQVLHFKTCAKGGEYTGLGANTPSSYAIGKPASNTAEFQTLINSNYSSDPGLAGKVTAIGNGWQKFVVPSTGMAKISVRGAAGGCTSNAGFSINPTTGTVSGTGLRGGRGAKVEGTCKLKKGDILYMLVGIRGGCSSYSNGGNWGPGGGGASAILKDNPSGKYTFSPLNRKVDVLFVAGGGGGSHYRSYHGGDASYQNGANTSAGATTANCCTGGGGLTASSSGGGSGTVPGYSLLSGSASGSVSSYYQGGWGGGGSAWYGGGGGGGYSGGAARDNGQSLGGTSYINPDIVTETFRGYADPTNDASRGLTNPWINGGHIEIVLGRSESKLILAKDSDGYKWFNGSDLLDGTSNPSATDEWEPVPDSITNDNGDTIHLIDATGPSELAYQLFGNTTITDKTGLKDDVKFLICSTEADESLAISGNLNKVLIEQRDDISLSDVSVITGTSATYDVTNLDIRFAMSRDHGKTWYTYDPYSLNPSTGSWSKVDIHDREAFARDGFPLDQFSTISLTEWNRSKPALIRFAFIVTQNGSNGNAIMSGMNITCDLLGSWDHFEPEDAKYSYINDSELKITFKKAGNYKVNYLDSLNPGSSSDNVNE